MEVSRTSLAAVGVAACLMSGAASAAGFYQARASLSPGIYSNEGAANFPPNPNGPSPCDNQPFTSEGDGDILGGGLGVLFGTKLKDGGGTLVADFDIEALSVDADSDLNFASQPGCNFSTGVEFDRTDMKLTLGMSFDVGFNMTPFIGYRYAFQGDGFFNDDLYIETGYFLGVGVSGLEWVKDWNFSGSLAYNDTTIDSSIAGASDIDANGLSAQIGVRPKQAPFGFSLKYQNFDYDEGGLEKEDYLLASVVWYFMQGRM